MSGKACAPRLLPSVLCKILPIGVTLTIIIGFSAEWQVKHVFETELRSKLQRETEFAVQQIDSRIKAMKDMIATIASNDLIINGLVDEATRDSSIRPLIRDMSIAMAPEAHLGFTDYRGRLIASNGGAGYAAEPKWLDTVMAGEQYAGIDSENVTLAVPVLFKGRAEGAIYLVFRTSTLASFISAPYLADASALSLDGAEISKNVSTAGLEWNAGEDDPGWVVSSAASATYPALSLALAGEAGRVFAPLSALVDFLVGVSVANLAVLALGLVVTAMMVARPLTRLAGELASVNVAEDLDSRVSMQGYSEIADVANKFNEMLARLGGAMVSHDLLLAENRERRKAEQELTDQRAEIVAVFETVMDGIVTIEGDGVIRTVNQAVSEIFGYEAEELIGQNVSILMPPEYAARHDSYIRAYNETGQAKIIGMGRELEAVKKNGEVFPMELFISKMEVKGENLFVGVVRDITDRIKVDTMKREFISIVSHELRTPLTAMIGALGLMDSGSFGKLPIQSSSLLKLAQNNAKRLMDLVNDILDIEKLESDRIELEMEEIDIIKLVRQAYADNLPYANHHNVRFCMKNYEEEIGIRGDVRRLGQVLANLLSNAAKFSDENDTVTISVEQEGGSVRIGVEDTGPGIPPDAIEKIFGKFYQVDSTDTRGKQGTGLGLAISQSIIRQHGSELKVKSTLGKGSTFYFDLPAIYYATNQDEDSFRQELARGA